MLSPPLLPLSPVWSHAAMGGARGCSVAVPSLPLNKGQTWNCDAASLRTFNRCLNLQRRE